MDIPILPCKRCGCKPEITVKEFRHFLFFKYKLYIFTCGKCGLYVYDKNEKKAILMWNRNIGGRRSD